MMYMAGIKFAFERFAHHFYWLLKKSMFLWFISNHPKNDEVFFGLM